VAYQLDRYNDWGTDRDQPPPETIQAARLKRSAILCDTAGGLVAALSELQERLPFTHVALWTRPPGVTHEAACANLERVAGEVAPAFADGPPPTGGLTLGDAPLGGAGAGASLLSSPDPPATWRAKA
jgi:hypothetical protein